MHVRQLVQLAGWAAAHGQELIHSEAALPESAIQQYWLASKCRIQRWTEVLRRYSGLANDSSGAFASEETTPNDPKRSGVLRAKEKEKVGQCGWHLAASVEEILLSELLSRVWAALLVGYDRRHGRQQAGPLAQSILQDHLEVRSRVLHLLLQPKQYWISQTSRLNQLRTQVERWIDLLLAALADLVPATAFAIDPSRVQDFAGDFSLRMLPAQRQQAWKLTLASLNKSFQRNLQPGSANPDLNKAIAQAVVQCLPRDFSLWNLEDEGIWRLLIDCFTEELENLLTRLSAEEGASSVS